jgi:hypothetical protein
MPAKLVRSRFEALMRDRSVTPWMRAKVEKALDYLD